MFYCMTKGARSLILVSCRRNHLFQYQFDTFHSRLGRQIATATKVGQNLVVGGFWKGTGKMSTKPPNVLVYSNGPSVNDDLIATLGTILESNSYTVYPLTEAQVEARAWPESTALLIVHGMINEDLGAIFLDYFLNGGRLFSVCCNLLSMVLPNGPEEDKRGPEMVTLSYGQWQKVRMLQQTMTCDSGAVGTHFTKQLKDLQNCFHQVTMNVLACEETFSSPSILTATCSKNNGKAVFTQLLLAGPIAPYLKGEDIVELQNMDRFKSDIIFELLSSKLDIKTAKYDSQESVPYKNAYLLGEHGDKLKLLNELNDATHIPNTLKLGEITLQFCSKVNTPPPTSLTILPVLTEQTPEDFSLNEYFQHLKTSLMGRVALYFPVITSSMVVVSNASFNHGFVVIPRRQTHGNGRHNNQWLSPEGCAMFSMQLHVPLASPLGQRLPMIQHLVAIAVVGAVRNLPGGYNALDIRLKWPNDIYANGRIKIGGLIIQSQVYGSQAIVNIGCGVNLSNSSPTLCINDLIREFNRSNHAHLPLLGYEQTLALIFTEIETLFNQVQCGDLQTLYQLYYKYWLHEDQSVTVKIEGGAEVGGKVCGVDEYGYLLVTTDGSEKPICVHPDGNSFDMMKGLIIPKYF